MKCLVWDRKRLKKRFGEKGVKDTELLLDYMTRKGFSILQSEAEKIPEKLKKFEKPNDVFILLGGDDLIPFGRVKNPAYDGDEYVYTDNIYSSSDDDLLLPERIVARLPDGGDIEFLHLLIQKLGEDVDKKRSFGMSAKVWKLASREVFRVLNGRRLLLSPPVTYRDIELPSRHTFFYFNLHGSQDTPFWYGQEGDRYPVAITPKNLEEIEYGVVATEACYGAYIIGKKIEESMSLTFLERGVSVFIGSTTIAYGPFKPPSTEADLIVKLFFEEMLKGRPAGKAFNNARHKFFRTMIKTQGFLDEDDQKTLLQFVFLGDPFTRYRR
ncbi:hypothetical protein DRQ23_03645 [bacterium]|nr:MAG: hypothetical protein DRQ23_03645 [bacterium]